MTDRELMQQALEALEYEAERGNDDGYRSLRDALRERLAQPEPAPGYCPHCKQYTIEEPVKESSVTHSHLWIGDLYGKEKNT